MQFEAQKATVVDFEIKLDPKVTVFKVTDPRIINWSWEGNDVDMITYEEGRRSYETYKCVDPVKAGELFRTYR